MLCGGALMFVVGIVARRSARLSICEKMTRLSLGAFVYLVLIGAIVGYTAYIWLLRHCDPAKVATYAYVNPVVAVLLGAFFAGETLTQPDRAGRGDHHRLGRPRHHGRSRRKKKLRCRRCP